VQPFQHALAACCLPRQQAPPDRPLQPAAFMHARLWPLACCCPQPHANRPACSCNTHTHPHVYLQADQPQHQCCSSTRRAPTTPAAAAAAAAMEPFQIWAQAGRATHRSIAVCAWQAHHHHSSTGACDPGLFVCVCVCECVWQGDTFTHNKGGVAYQDAAIRWC
jgi:hypothetical protein